MFDYEGFEAIERAWREGLTPDPLLTVSEWADRYRMLSSKSASEPGRWSTRRTPYLKEIMDCLSPSSPAERVVFMKGAQVGGTECGNNWIGYCIHLAPGPMMAVSPTVEMAKRNSRQRIDPLIEESPALSERIAPSRSRDAGNTVLAKEFHGGVLVMTGANSAVGLRSMPVRYLFLDEVDGYPADVEGEGDAIRLAEARTRTFARRKIFIVSTPTVAGASPIEREFEASDQRRYFVPCPHCGHRQWLRFEQLRWQWGEPQTVRYVCEACDEAIAESHKTWMLEHGAWRATKPDAGQEPECRGGQGRPGVANAGKTVGFHLSSLYSPLGWRSWADIAAAWEAAQGSATRLKAFKNTELGEVWVEEGEAPDWERLLERREAYPLGTVPAGGLLLVGGADVQKDRIEASVWAFGRGKEAWLVEHRVLMGDTARDAVWKRLAEMLAETWTHESGARLPLVRFAIDTVSGALTRLRNAFLRAFGERDAGSGFTASLARAIQFLAAHIDLLIQLAGTALVAAFGRMAASMVASVAASRAEAAARLNNLRLIEAEATARLRAARAALAQAAAQGKATTALRADLARAAQEAIKARRAVTAAARGTTLLARAGGLLRGALALLGGPIGLIVTGLGLLAAAAFSARDKVAAFGGKTATIGQIVSATWDLVTEKIGAFVDGLISLVGINDKTWASLRETVIDGVNAIGRAVRTFVNGIIGTFNAVGKVVGITAAFLVRRFKRAFSDIAALARALGRDIAASFKGDFSLRHLKAALRAGRDEMRGFGKALGDAVKESLGRDYVGETAQAIAARIRSEKKRQRLFAQPQAKGTPSAEDNAARLKLAQAQSDAELRILKEGLAQASRALDRALADRLVSIREYYDQKTAIEQREIDAEIARKRQALAAQRRILREAGDEKARLDARASIAKIEADLIALNNRRREVEVANARKAAAAERELRDALARARDELALLTGTGTDAQRREAIARAYRDLRARLLAENDTAGASLIDRLIDVKAAQANLDALESRWRLTAERMRNAFDAIRIQQQAGLLTEAQAREQIVRLQQQSAAEMERLLPLMEQAARAIGPEAVARVQAWKNELARTRLVVDEVAVRVKGQVQDAFATMFEQIGSGAKSAREAFRDFARSVIASINRIAAQKLAQSLFGGISGGIGGFVGALFRSGAGGFAAGGYVTGPGTSTSDSIPARLSAGEYVINAASVRKVGVAFLDAINGGAFAPRWRGPNLAFATGGLVPNAGRREKPQVNVRVVNAVDESLVGDFLATPAGEQVITNVIRRNAATVRQYLGS